ncbi:aliphatic sulfonate ABC transporter substrate-binding protein [Anaerocolumna sedimenticola]|uniref:Aliphatic sulfonate ABC transporter substrate-binding protein n=2 Tax=Anaerocolumna sedimenticola TaxID=2696063 RepID=A0A6P1TRP5_9FIRM|nr:aliphatic sulfonate ABC transporter substrate-binding protein [Anaerocolumna sedimenticola]
MAGCSKKVTDTNTDITAQVDSKTEEGSESKVEDTKAADTDSSVETTEETTVDTASTNETSNLPTGHKADTVKIGFVDVTGTGINSDTLGLARDQGFIDEELGAIGVKADFVPMTGAGPAINEALAGGSLDVGFLGDVPAIIGKSAGIDTQLIVFNGLNSGASLVVPKDSDFKTVQYLKGKKIATQKGAFMHKVFIDILSANGLSIDDVEFVNLNAQGSAEALVSGSVDAAVVGGSTLSNLIEKGYGRVLVDYREHPEWNCGGYGIARTAYINDNPDIIKALLRALVKAQKLAKSDDTVMLKQWTTTGDTETSYEYLYPKHNNYYSIIGDEKEIASGKNTIQFLLDNGLIENEFNFEEWVNSSFSDAAYSELGE